MLALDRPDTVTCFASGSKRARSASKTRFRTVVALWEAFYIENKRFDLDTLRVANRSPTPASKINDVLGQSDDIWGARGPHFR